ncbi:MAG TPA: ATP-binding cassette domain-containing protein [Actinomycetota bacterium]
MTDTLRKLIHLLRPEGLRRWVAVVGLAVVASGLEAGAAILIFLLIGLITAPGGSIELPVIGDVTSRFDHIPRETLMFWVAGAVIVFFVLRGAFTLLQLYVQSRISQNVGARLAGRLFTGYLRMPYPFHLERSSSELVRNTEETVRAITLEVLGPIVRLLSSAILALAMLGVLIITAPLTTALAVAVLAPVVLLLLKVVQPRLQRWGARRQQLAKANLSVVQQGLHGIRDVKLLDAVPFFSDVYLKQRRAMARVTYLGRVGMEFPSILIETVLVVFIAAFFIVFLALDGSLGELLAVLGMFAYVALRLQPALQKITQSVTSLRFASRAVEHAYEDIVLTEAQSAEDDGDEELAPVMLRRELSLVDVSLWFPGRPEAALDDVNLTIAAGEAVGIVGPTGGGKSTLLDVIAGLLRPVRGEVLVDGVPLEGRERAWQRQLGVVSQAVFMIDGSIRQNIALGVADSEIDPSRLEAAVEVAQLSEFVRSLPDGLDTLVGERGVRVSGGQRQRVAIARALYRDAPVLILDEGTSALDNRTEAAFMKALHRSRAGRTIIMVAHRLSTVRGCDRIVLIGDGRVVDVGTFEQVAARNDGLVRVGPDPAHHGPLDGGSTIPR